MERLMGPKGAMACVLAALICATGGAATPHDALPSWNDGPARSAITDFVEGVTTEGSPDFVQSAERIAVFDNDGCLWSEQPAYFQLLFAMDRVKELAPQHPEWHTTEPFKAVLEGDMHALAASGKKGLLELVMATHAGMTTDEFEDIVRTWLSTVRHPTTGRRYTEMVFQPMLELLDYLRLSGFKTFIVSGGGIEFIRVFAEDVYGVPPEQVIGSSNAEHRTRHRAPARARLHRRQGGQAGRHPQVHRPAADRRVWQLRRRPSDAPVDRRG
jgi:phosphoglycolate phosphatase-like HAD superfamily hydrolase